jgi:nitroimidazol reductase NimA-like FMN-containing flavoprotein (pyridoxamine 5'-phosphate oxidase superfamily)
MDRRDVAEVLAKPRSQELLDSWIPARLAYVGADGGPRVVPMSFLWDGEHVLMATPPGSPKIAALERNARVAITIDTEARDQWPPRMLLIRGTARLETVDGMPDAYVEASRKVTPAEHFEDWERGARALYDRMVLITIAPDWAKLVDFETTRPDAIDTLIRARSGD